MKFTITIRELVANGKASTATYSADDRDSAIVAACRKFIANATASFHENPNLSKGSRLVGQISHKLKVGYAMATEQVVITYTVEPCPLATDSTAHLRPELDRFPRLPHWIY